MKSYILLENIQLFAHHGVFPQETTVGNTFIINLKIKTDVSDAVKTDDLTHTISYATVFDIVKSEMAVPSKLLEHIAGRIIQALRKQFGEIEEIELKISKQNPPLGGQVEYASIVLID